ncbi:MAG TPA: hypothetical protein VMU04_11375 [Candidatus Acidoferrum sp.]|nr:hypothetical protein [Candidatus Acidoferrum sp.]
MDALSLEMATEAELQQAAEYGPPAQRREARRLLLERCRWLARVAARELRETLKRYRR